MPDPQGKLTESRRIRVYETDGHGLATFACISNLLQESAGRHAERLGFGERAMAAHGLAWVLFRQYIHLERRPAGGEEVFLTTWPVRFDALRGRRDFLLADEDGRPLGRAATVWVGFDPVLRKSSPLPDIFKSVPLTAQALDVPPGKPPRLAEPERETALPIRRSDVDRNGHVHNVTLLEMLLEAPDGALLHKGGPKAMDIMFRAEVRHGDVVLSRCGAPDEDGWMPQALVRASDGTELVRARSLWNH